VGAVVEGGLEPETWFVVDFIALKRLLKQLTEELDHRVLLPAQNPKLSITERGDALAVAYGGQERYVFPKRDCVLLPIPNTTVELIAPLLAGRLRGALRTAGARLLNPTQLGEGALQRIAVPRPRHHGLDVTHREELAEGDLGESATQLGEPLAGDDRGGQAVGRSGGRAGEVRLGLYSHHGRRHAG